MNSRAVVTRRRFFSHYVCIFAFDLSQKHRCSLSHGENSQSAAALGNIFGGIFNSEYHHRVVIFAHLIALNIYRQLKVMVFPFCKKQG